MALVLGTLNPTNWATFAGSNPVLVKFIFSFCLFGLAPRICPLPINQGAAAGKVAACNLDSEN